ncbi:IS110 family transposase [Methylobacterium sp. 391_Methyba4]|uniref:IS110 family transposase n=1 Tax=Methylobacterium sp. 391_Methyba4 TaxID=3038924 RepID=UPI00241E1AC2|nr:IS110 family transposase [Methylobacterium sp. 391_Methyba4]WFS09633.1 IS110 family transposase [Methylobacterium sp. 391_Methyba4]
MHAITPDAVFIGVDTHKDVHVAVAINGLGARLATASFPVTSVGYREVAAWAAKHGVVHAFGIEGTGSYGAGLTRALTAMGLRVIEVGRVNRQLRRRQGKTDTVDAESAARAVLAGEATDEPKLGDGAVEMIRHLKIARDTALKARTQAMVTLKTLLVNAPQALRERFIGITGKMTLIRAIAALRPGAPVSTTASAKVALRALANRWLVLDAEIKEHDAVLEQLVRAQAPALMDAPGVSTGTIAEMLVVLGDNPQRIRSEAAFAKLCGVCPVPASSGKTSRHRLNRGGNRRANAALYRVAVVRMRHHLPTREYIQRRTNEGKSPREIRRCLKRYIAREIYRHLCIGSASVPDRKTA